MSFERNRLRKILRNRRRRAEKKAERRAEDLAFYQEAKKATLSIYDNIITLDMFTEYDENGDVESIDYDGYRKQFKRAWRATRLSEGLRPPSAHGCPVRA